MPRNPRGSWGRRLLWTQMAVVAAMAATTVLTALLVGPAWFRMHMLEAGHAQPDVVEHAQQAFHDAGLVSLAVGLGTAMLAALGVATVLNRNLSRGVEALVDGAQHVAAGHYDQPVMMTSASPELAQVADAFNHMASQIASTEQTRRRMLTDLGHELRTPITVIRGQLELLNDASYEERERSISLTIDELDRMARIVNDLLTLAIADSADFVHPTMVDAAELTIDIEDKTHVMATRTIRLTAVAEGMVYVDEQRITQAMLELFNNAIRHTTDNDAIEIGSAFIGQGENRILRLWIRDFGPGIPADVLPGLFERFSRGRGSIKRHNGAGLGLSIVRAIADAHDGSAWVESSEGYGATFGLDLPAGRPYDGDDQGTVS